MAALLGAAGLAGSITGAVAAAGTAVAETAERNAIKATFLFLISDSWVDRIQGWRRKAGLPATAGTLIVPMIILAIFGIIWGILKGVLWKLFQVSIPHWRIILVIFIIFIGIFYIHRQINGFTNMASEGFAVVRSSTKTVPPGDPERTSLVNIQPVCVKQAGYTGPAEDRGAFKTDVSIMSAIGSGVRMFTLQIDYVETSMRAGFDPPNFPTLVYRDNGGELVSTNGASISDIATKLSTYAFNADFNAHTQPIILYLHFVRTPDPIMDPTKYQTFMENVATALKPIQDQILTKADGTDYTKQQAENLLMYTPLSRFEKKVLILTNANTSLLRPLNLPNEKNLDYMTSMRVYLGSSEDLLGITMMPSGSNKANAIIVSYGRIANMIPSQRTAFAQENVGRFVIVMPKPMESPSEDEIQSLFTTCGVNVVPMNLFGETQTVVKPKIASWNGQPFYNLKPTMLQSDKAAVMGYMPPPTI